MKITKKLSAKYVSATKPQVSEWKPSLSDPESPEFEALANTIEEDLKGMLLR